MRVLAVLGVLAVLSGAAQASPFAYVSNERSGTVSVIDTATNKVVSTLKVGSRPRGIHVNGNRVFVALSDTARQAQSTADAILAFDLAGRRILGRYDAGSDPEQFAVSRDGSTLFTSNEDAGTASITRLGKVIATLIVGIEPEGVAISPDGRWVYVTAETSNTVSVIDTQARKVVASFLVDPRPRAAAFSPKGDRAYITAEIGGTVSVVDTATHQVIDVIDLGSRAKPVGVVASPDGRRVYVANGHGNSVAVIDIARGGKGKVIQAIPVGRRPWGIAITRDGKRVYTANGLSNDVSVIDTATGRVMATVKVGEGAWGVSIGS